MRDKELTSNKKLIGRDVSNLVYSLNFMFPNVGIYIKSDDRIINAHSILGVISLSINAGDTIHIISDSTEELFDEIYNHIKSFII